MKVVIVGGVAGGASAAARLRRLDEQAEIVVLERGPYISYANCGLPYYIGGDISEKSALTLQTPESFYSRFRIDVRVNSEVTAIDRANRQVTVQCGETVYQERYDKLILSPGAKPILPPIPGVDSERVFTLRTIPDTEKIRAFIETHQPKTAVVVGGGYIGAEMAENLSQAGLSVTIVELSDHVIGPLDFDIACEVRSYLEHKGIRVLLNTGVEAISLETDETLLVSLSKSRSLKADMVLLSAGVLPDTALAKAAGLVLSQKDAIRVDQHMQTSDPDIYAVGDAVEIVDYVSKHPGYVPLAGPANKQGRIAADNICGYPSVYNGTQGSSVLKLFDMTIAATGLSERAARAAGYACDKVFTFSPSHAGYYPGASNLSIKTVFELETGKILGAQIVGFSGVDKRIDVFATAIRANMTAFDLAQLELAYAPPYSSAKDPVNMAGFVIENILTKKFKQFHWHDVATLPKDGSVTLLDVRTDSERKNGFIPGSVHIPLDRLRGAMDKLDRQKPVYVNCHSGLRSYIACRILTQNGFDCYNLSGGFRLYEKVMLNAAFDGTPRHACGIAL